MTTGRHFPQLRRVTGGWLAGCGCGWQAGVVVARERAARRRAWDHIGAASREVGP